MPRLASPIDPVETNHEPQHRKGVESAGPGPSHGQRRSRRLSDKILITFHAACDVREFTVARQLLATLEDMHYRVGHHSPLDQRRSSEALVAAYERLWHLTNRAT